MRRHAGSFYVFEIAHKLARHPGHLEWDWDEAHRIGSDMYDWYMGNKFGDREVLANYEDSSSLVPIAEIKEQARQRGRAWDEVDPGLFYAAFALTSAAAKRYIEGCGPAGAPRLLREWFGVAEAKSHKPGPKRIIRDAIKTKMLADLRSRRRTVEELKADTQAVLVSEYGGS
jgi:hypothetical protein